MSSSRKCKRTQSHLEGVLQLPAKKLRAGKKISGQSEHVKGKADLVRIGNSNVQFGKNLSYLTDSTSDYVSGKFEVLKKRLEEEGVLLIRGMIPRDDAIAARKIIMDLAHKKGAFAQKEVNYDYAKISKPKGKYIEGWTVDAVTGGAVAERDNDSEGWSKVGNNDILTRVYDGEYLHKFYAGLFQKDSVKTFPENTWIRLKGHADVTIEHADYYYFKKNTHMLSSGQAEITVDSICESCSSHGSSENMISCSLCGKFFHQNCVNYSKTVSLDDADLASSWHCSKCADAHLPFYTCWVSLSNVDTKNSTLGFIPRSHKLSGYNNPPKNKQTPAEYELVRNSSSWCIPENGLQPGDVFLFNIKTIHAATKNSSDEFRISMDTRLYGLS